MREPTPCPSASRGRIPPTPPTALGLMERPEWPSPRESPASWRRWLRQASVLLLGVPIGLLLLPFVLIVLLLERFGRGPSHPYRRVGYQGRVPINFPQAPPED